MKLGKPIKGIAMETLGSIVLMKLILMIHLVVTSL